MSGFGAVVSGEFERIDRFFAPLAKEAAGAFDLTDDAARLTLGKGLEFVVTTDTLVSGVHFLGSEAPKRLAQKLLRVSLSDLAGKGAIPHSYTLNISVPRGTDDDWFAAFASGFQSDQTLFNLSLLGGDTVATNSDLVLSATVFGVAPVGQSLLRRGAQHGDDIYVTGAIGDAALGLDAAQGRWPFLDEPLRQNLIDAYELPDPPVEFGARLLGLATAAMDVSDGLVGDLEKLCRASKMGAQIYAENVPLSDAASRLISEDLDLLNRCLVGGDDYQILFCAPQCNARKIARLSQELMIRVSKIGLVKGQEGDGVRVLDRDGGELNFSNTGFVHR